MNKKSEYLHWFENGYEEILSGIDHFERALESYGVDDIISIGLKKDINNKRDILAYKLGKYHEYLLYDDIESIRRYNHKVSEKVNSVNMRWGGLLK